MQNSFLDFKVAIIFCISLFAGEIHAQLEFCQGNSGDPIFTETFGTGTTNNSLPNGVTTYNYTNGFPDDGFYTVSNGSFGNTYDWHQTEDHTIGDTNGKNLIVNASLSPGEFYKATVSGLCENTTYEFSAWLLNLARADGFCSTQPSGIIPINVSFEIWDNTDTNLLASGDTGDIFSTITPNWQQYALVFQTLAGQTSVILKMRNNGVGGCGNDLAIDDIVFKSCGDLITVVDSNNNSETEICSSLTPYSDTLRAIPDNQVFSDHFYQWQISTDGSNWTDVVGETNVSITFSGVTTTTYFRAKVAEYQSNLSNSDCITFSDVYIITVNEAPPRPTIECWEVATLNDTTCTWTITGTQPAEPTGIECWETATFNDIICAWEISGTQPAEPDTECWQTASFNNESCTWEITGTQPTVPDIECWQTATFNAMACIWEVTGTQPVEPTDLLCWQTTVFNEDLCDWEVLGTQPIKTRNEFLILCENQTLTLEAISEIENPIYQWDLGEQTLSITIDNSGVYIVEVSDGCLTEIITFNVSEIEIPVIESIVSDGSSIIVNLSNIDNYQYSLNGVDYQISNIFTNKPNGLYTIYVRSNECNFAVTKEHLHLYIQKYMTPNGDGIKDFFSLNILQYFTSTDVYIFNRYGKLLFSAKNRNVNWDGTFRNKKLPSSDYWYRIIIDGKEYKGHFTLKR